MLPIPRILIVDDYPDHRLILAYQLAKIGPLDIREAGDGRQALAVLATAAPDLICMNLGLPLLDGWRPSATSAPCQLRSGKCSSSRLRSIPGGGKNKTHATR
jgi:CheY-like chemotaxis protein